MNQHNDNQNQGPSQQQREQQQREQQQRERRQNKNKGQGENQNANPNPNAPPMGLRVRLAASYDLSRFTGTARVIAQALKQYGAFVADNGRNWSVSGTSDRRWDDTNIDQLKTIPGAAFQVVQSGTLIHRC